MATIGKTYLVNGKRAKLVHKEAVLFFEIDGEVETYMDRSSGWEMWGSPEELESLKPAPALRKKAPLKRASLNGVRATKGGKRAKKTTSTRRKSSPKQTRKKR